MNIIYYEVQLKEHIGRGRPYGLVWEKNMSEQMLALLLKRLLPEKNVEVGEHGVQIVDLKPKWITWHKREIWV